MKLIKLTMIHDLRFKNKTEINDGKIWIGVFLKEPEVGQTYFISNKSTKYHERGYVTDKVLEIIDENRFRTKNAVYLHEEYIENEE